MLLKSNYFSSAHLSWAHNLKLVHSFVHGSSGVVNNLSTQYRVLQQNESRRSEQSVSSCPCKQPTLRRTIQMECAVPHSQWAHPLHNLVMLVDSWYLLAHHSCQSYCLHMGHNMCDKLYQKLEIENMSICGLSATFSFILHAI